jgi:hypothetical protein
MLKNPQINQRYIPPPVRETPWHSISFYKRRHLRGKKRPMQFLLSSFLAQIYSPPAVTWHCDNGSPTPFPRSYRGRIQRSWLVDKVDSGIGLRTILALGCLIYGKCVQVDCGVGIRWGYSQLRHRVPFTMFFFGFDLCTSHWGADNVCLF